MSWMIMGTLPYEDFPLVDAKCGLVNGVLRVGDRTVPVVRGTTALMAAACATATVLGCGPPRAILAGDIGLGDGSARVYEHLIRTLSDNDEIKTITFHYLLPEIDWHNRILIKLDDLSERPVLIADAGYMYVAKMSGFAASYDLFTPDVGEMAFLADERAPHPFYTRGFLLQEDERVPELIERAYKHENAAHFLLVKGRCDFVASEEGILEEISEPCVENMEPIGGTGDSLTGVVSALIAGGFPIPQAATIAAKANRIMGALKNPTPAFSIADLLPALPAALKQVVSDWNKGIAKPPIISSR
jgi:ADP-dependent NAD(P)H-hydrate dehydratase / NAD(P)H-hydrate epimerase